MQAGDNFFIMETLKTYHALGLMSSSSLDGVRAALIKTDGVDVFEAHKSFEFPFEEELSESLRGLQNSPQDFDAEYKKHVAKEFTEFNSRIVQELQENGQIIDVIGFHGHILQHNPSEQSIEQLGDSQSLANAVKIKVISRFRAADIAAGGLGAPMSAVYHMALAQKLKKPLVFLNIDGLSSLTYIGANGEVVAFDIGVGMNAINNWVYNHAGQQTDYNGSLAACGQVDEHVLAAMMRHKFLAHIPPKVANVQTFKEKLENLEGLKLGDGTATATAFVAEEAAYSMALYLPEVPPLAIICGAGAKNPTLLRMLRQKLSGVEVVPSEYFDIDSQGVEAQAFAYLAVRRLHLMPTSYPFTTGVHEPIIGGEIFEPK